MMLLPKNFDGLVVHLVGVKGTGMCALAELLVALGARVSGSDVEEEFYTDAILAEIGVNVGVFNAGLDEAAGDGVSSASDGNLPIRTDVSSLIGNDVDLVIRSAAYDESNVVVAEANRRGLPILSYPEMLGELSRGYEAAAVAGVHGKTTTAAMAGILIRALELPATVVVGSAVRGFGEENDGNSSNFSDKVSSSQDAVSRDYKAGVCGEREASISNSYRSVWRGGDRFLVAETCEYRRHFLHFFPEMVVLSSVESDHQDYFPDYASISLAFVELCNRLPEGGELIYCFDNDGARDVAVQVNRRRPDVRMIPYGTRAVGKWRIEIGNTVEKDTGRNLFRLNAFDCDFELRLPGRHSVLDAAAALALVYSLCAREPRNFNWTAARRALAGFQGSRRRSEIIGEVNELLVIDDYAHHPTSITSFLEGLRDFYPGRRLIVDFMPHTYSRTAAMIESFTRCFDCVDILLLHPIYSSAREKYDGGIDGLVLWKKVSKRRGKLERREYKQRETFYCETLDQAARTLGSILRAGDLFVTLGAGNNRSLGPRVLREYG